MLPPPDGGQGQEEEVGPPPEDDPGGVTDELIAEFNPLEISLVVSDSL